MTTATATKKRTMNATQVWTVRLVGSALAKLVGGELLMADLLNALLCCDADARLSDAEAAAGELLFDILTDYRPDAVDLARSH